MEHIKERVAYFGAFKDEARRIKITFNTIQTSISLWKEYLETTIKIMSGYDQVNRTLIIG